MTPQPAAGRRRCSRSACSAVAVATLTYAYADSTAVVGPLSPYSEPHNYDLCARHATTLTAPRGWSVLRLEPALNDDVTGPAEDDLLALAEAVREAGRGPRRTEAQTTEPGRRGHLRALPTPTPG